VLVMVERMSALTSSNVMLAICAVGVAIPGELATTQIARA
jgi:hypothetical protein